MQGYLQCQPGLAHDPRLEHGLRPGPGSELLVKHPREQKRLEHVLGKFHALTRIVKLYNGGLMETPHSTEKWAWTYIKRALYAHRSMLKEIRETVELIEAWDSAVKEINFKIG